MSSEFDIDDAVPAIATLVDLRWARDFPLSVHGCNIVIWLPSVAPRQCQVRRSLLVFPRSSRLPEDNWSWRVYSRRCNRDCGWPLLRNDRDGNTGDERAPNDRCLSNW